MSSGFWLWAVPGALLALALLGLASIGMFVLPFALVALWLVARRAPRREAFGLLAGIGVTLGAIGLLQLGEPGMWWWLCAGAAFLLMSLSLRTWSI